MEKGITAIIPIRSGSKRCQKKSIRPFGNTSLLELRINTLKKVKGIDRIQVNSESDEILDIAKRLGVETFKRDPKYSADDADGVMVYECLSQACPTDTMLIAFTPTPFIEASDYQNCIDIFNKNENDSVISVKHKKDYMFHNKKPVNFDPLKTCRSQDLPKYYSMTFGVTIVKTSFVKEFKSIWTQNPYFYEVDEIKALDIDTNLDFFICEQLYKNNLASENLLDTHMDLSDCDKDTLSSIPSDVYMGAVYDALNQIMDSPEKRYLDIKPKACYKKLIHGPAFTISSRRVNKNDDYTEVDKIRYKMYKPELFANNPIVMLERNNDNSVAHFGDITCKVYKKLGAKCLITDGIGRDIDIIDDFPVFCTGVSPIDAFEKWAYVDYQKPIHMSGLDIYPGDYVFADSDGVIVVERSMLESFKKELNKIMDKERATRTFIDNCNLDTMDKEIEEFILSNGRF